MEYSKKFIKEVIRLKSPVAAFYRAVTDDFKLDGYTVPKGAAFMYHLSAVQHHVMLYACCAKCNYQYETEEVYKYHCGGAAGS
eukprot:12971-Heterococcus_DN1.PRE.2